MLPKIVVLLALCLCLWAGIRLLTRRSSERLRVSPRELADLVAERLALMRQGAILHAIHEVDAAHEFCFLKGEDTGSARQNVLFALIEPEGEDMRFDQAADALRSLGMEMEVKSSHTSSGHARVLAVALHGTPELIARDAGRIVSEILAKSGGTDQAAFDVAIFGRADRAIRNRMKAGRVVTASGSLLLPRSIDP